MISPVSHQPTVNPQPMQPSNAPAAPAQPAKTEDTAKLSDHAKATISKGDVDHDGDGH